MGSMAELLSSGERLLPAPIHFQPNNQEEGKNIRVDPRPQVPENKPQINFAEL